ncbi:MAG: VacJ family lipoprotein [Alphaproteobacteria bacterium]
MRKIAILWLVFLLTGTSLLLSGCASTQNAPTEERTSSSEKDPFENINRGIFAFNQAADKAVLKPVAQGYRRVVPNFIRSAVYNVFETIKQPNYFLNAVLQGNPKDAMAVFARTAVNLTFGCLGLFDVASQMNIPAPDNDFGQTLAKWGWHDEGPFVMLPLLGPSNIRDATGLGGDVMANPVGWRLMNEPLIIYGGAAVEGFARRERAIELLDNLEKSSTDHYAAMRTMYRQNRQKKINKVLPEENQAPKAYEFDFEIEEEDE